MRTVLALLVPALVAPIAFALAGLASSSCTTDGDASLADQGFLPDGAPANQPDGASSTAVVACVFEELQTFTCPDVTLAPPAWVATCVDEDDCKTRVNGTSTVSGCSTATTYADVQEVQMTCAAWKASGKTLPVLDSGPVPVCAPGPVTSFKPTWHAPRAKMSACSGTQIASYLKCIDDAAAAPGTTPASCAEWGGTLSTADKTCLTCLSSNEADAQWGPLIALPTEQLLNVPGCLALAEGKTDGSGCGGLLQAEQQCDHAACLPTCETGTMAGVTAEVSCEAQANTASTGVCASYATAAACAGTIQTGGDAGTAAEMACFGLTGGAGSGTSDSEFTAVAMAFCGE